MATPEASGIQVVPMTADELLHLPDNGMRTELVRGELREMAPAGSQHGRLTVNVTIPLGHYVKTHNLGAVFAAETGYIIERTPDTVRAPDVSFIRRERIEEAGEVVGFWPGSPDLVVEVISPGEIYTEVVLTDQDTLDGGDVIPGWHMPVAEIFE